MSKIYPEYMLFDRCHVREDTQTLRLKELCLQ